MIFFILVLKFSSYNYSYELYRYYCYKWELLPIVLPNEILLIHIKATGILYITLVSSSSTKNS